MVQDVLVKSLEMRRAGTTKVPKVTQLWKAKFPRWWIIMIKSRDTYTPEQTEEKEPHQSEEEGIALLNSYRDRLNKNDNLVFLEMFELLITKMSTIETSIRSIKSEQKQVSKRLQQLENNLECFGQTIDEIDEDVENISEMNLKLVETVLKCEDKASSMQKNMESMVSKSLKGEMLVRGFDVNPQLNLRNQVQDFIKAKLKIKKKITVTSVHNIGKKTTSPVWFKLEDPDDALMLLQSAKNLKGKTTRMESRMCYNSFSANQIEKNKHTIGT